MINVDAGWGFSYVKVDTVSVRYLDTDYGYFSILVALLCFRDSSGNFMGSLSDVKFVTGATCRVLVG
jgi:hypothetical protein